MSKDSNQEEKKVTRRGFGKKLFERATLVTGTALMAGSTYQHSRAVADAATSEQLGIEPSLESQVTLAPSGGHSSDDLGLALLAPTIADKLTSRPVNRREVTGGLAVLASVGQIAGNHGTYTGRGEARERAELIRKPIEPKDPKNRATKPPEKGI